MTYLFPRDLLQMSGPARAGLASVSVIALVAAMSAGPARADTSCETETSDSGAEVYVCSVEDIEIDIDVTDLDDDVDEVLFESTVVIDVPDDDDYDFSFSGEYVFDLQNVGDEGDSHGDDGDDVNGIAAYYLIDDLGVEVSGGTSKPVFALVGEGGKGHSGKDRTSVTSSGHGGDGGDGGDVSDGQQVFIDYAAISGDAYSLIETTATGGNGASGGKGRSYGTSDGKGGDGGAGGAGSFVEVSLNHGASIDLTTSEDDVPGVYLFSSGGDGGDGGKAEGGTNAKAGDGGDGGAASSVIFFTSDVSPFTLSTSGDLAHGIEALSQGGDGGDGGDASESTGDSSGGDGGAGGDAGIVWLDIDTVDISTSGSDAIGILARSYGGAGGDGGSAESTFGSGSGGSSKDPGDANEVIIDFGGTITTTGSGDSSDDDGDDEASTSSAILAQSVGGFAGDAGDSSGLFYAYGASSESAGDGNTVTVTLDEGTAISTSGNYSDGVELQSIGGGGGKGGSATSLDSVGGDGSSGGDGGTVTLTVNGSDDGGTSISTQGTESSAISAQSIGGGGGKSGSASGVSGVGGTGGDGGAAGTVTLAVTADLSTEGENAEGILAQSLGGGGGKSGTASGVVSVGGTGGDGGDGGAVSVTLSGDVTTQGEAAEGVFVQSIGGGGGKAMSDTGVISAVGGTGGDGGDGDAVAFVFADGSISTQGDDADGVDLQSVGGGGGKARATTSVDVEVSVVVGGDGGDGGDGSTVDYSETGSGYTITTQGADASGISAQSGGGGGGNAGNTTTVSASVALGVSLGTAGSSGAGGDGSTVSVDTSADITTAGTNADAIFAQSYGGGGGNAGTVTSVSAGVDLLSISAAVGANGGNGGDGDAVTVVSSGAMTTSDDNSHGVFAQSVGGGGGKASSAWSVSTASAAALDVSAGGTGGSGGDAGAVTVENTGDITTGDGDGNGDNSAAIYAQSSGGGGGNSGQTWALDAYSLESADIAVGGDGGTGGDAGDVTVTNSGKIITNEDNSDGIFAQSAGGGGGNSKLTFAASGVSVIGTLGLSIGGDSGDGSAAGAVSVTNEGSITTYGDNASAIYAESGGGGGGNSQATVTGTLMQLGAVDISVGGDGGAGGTSSTISVGNSGSLSAGGDNSVGIYALSRGGSGGNASTTSSVDVASSGSLTVSVGGSGGDGGTADDVAVINEGEIYTYGDLGHGIIAQSVGGSGGNSSTIIDFSLDIGTSVTDGVSAAASVAVGADGGDGGEAGAVTVANTKSIYTSSDLADAIKAQSVGGDGGSAGSIYVIQASAGSTSISADVALGGSGASGSLADTVDVENEGYIQTSGYRSRGIFAQSQGGSGGDGGSVTSALASITTTTSASASIAVGGDGGDGALGGAVTVGNSAGIKTSGIDADAIYAQSVGGDGGSGGTAAAYALDLTSPTSGAAFNLDISFAMGGDGGSGNDADSVSVTNSGEIEADFTSSRGIFAQSVGGGGGDGGSAEATAFAYATSALSSAVPEDYYSLNFSFALEIGGDGGASGDGGAVDVENTGAITTYEDTSDAIFAQSVGGGGGTGGDSGTTSSDSDSTATEALEDGIDGVVTAFSIYGLYSNYKSYFTNWTFSFGGDGGASGDGDAVTVSNTSALTTSGNDSTGIYAQSVGGGGGAGGAGTGAAVTTKAEIGGSSASGGYGGDVSVTNSGDITTTGERSNGIWAQSVGGGGGDAGDVEAAFSDALSYADFKVALDIGVTGSGDAGNGGDGGAVSVSSTDADISVSGDNALGIWAQSVGGGGGSSGNYGTITAFQVGSSGSEGDSGDVSVSLDGGSITASGEYGLGIFAQSSSGSYDTDDDTSDLDSYFEYEGDESYDSGDVTIALTDGASVRTTGTDGLAIVAASTAWDDAGAVSITVDADSSVTGTSDNSHVISIYDGNSNLITNAGTIEDAEFTSTSRDDDVYVIWTDVTSEDYNTAADDNQGNVTITNTGTISGSISLYQYYDDVLADLGDLDATGNTFSNESGGTFNMGSTVNLGVSTGSGYGDLNSVLSNAGTLSPGGVDQIFTSSITNGLLEANDGGTLLFDLQMSTDSDEQEADLIVADEISVLDGTVEVNVTDTGDVADGDSGSIYIIVTDTLDDDDPGLTASDSAIVDYDVTVLTDADVTVDGTSYSGVNAVELSYSIDVGSSGANVNTTELSSYLTSDSSDDDTSTDDTSSSETGSSSFAVSASGPSGGAGSSDAVSQTTTGTAPQSTSDAMSALYMEMLNSTSLDELEAMSATHVLDEAGAAVFATRRSNQAAHNELNSCPSLSRSISGGFLREENCFWVSVTGSESQYENEAGGETIDESTFGLAAGAQRVLDNGLILGGLLEGEDVSMTGTSFRQEGNRFTFGAVVKRENGPFTYSLSAAYGRQSLTQDRGYAVSGSDYTATSDIDSDLFSADARVSYLQTFEANYLRWGIGAGVYHARLNGFDESGTGPLNWSVSDTTQTDVLVRPSIEFGRSFGAQGSEGRVFVNAGITVNLSDPETSLSGTLIGQANTNPMAHVFSSDRTTADIGLGFDRMINDTLRVSLRGGGVISENLSSGNLSGGLEWRF